VEPQKRPKHSIGGRLQIVAYCSDYPLIYSQSKDFLMRIMRAIRHQSESDYWSDFDPNNSEASRYLGVGEISTTMFNG
jgi:hypothetical protein